MTTVFEDNLLLIVIALLIGIVIAWWAFRSARRGARPSDTDRARLDALAKAEIGKAELSQVQVRFDRDPLRREAILSGQADQFQREGMGQLKGINGRIRAVPGVSGVRWEGE